MTAHSKRDGANTAANSRSLLSETPNSFRTDNFKEIIHTPPNYDYVNARLRARSRDFLPRETLVQMAHGNLEQAQKILQNSPYAQGLQNLPLLENLAVQHNEENFANGLYLESVVARETEKRYDDLKTWAKGETRLLLSVLSIGSDLENGMLFLRSCVKGQTEYIPFLPVCGELSSDFWRRLGSARGDRAMISEICRLEPSDFSDMLDDARSLLDRSGDVREAEWFYKKEIFSWAREALNYCGSGALCVRSVVDYSIDLWNIRLWMDNHYGNEVREIRFLEGGTLRRDDLLFAKTRKALLRDTFWQVPADSADPNMQTMLALDKKFFQWQISLRRQDPLGAQVMISYLARFYCEWRNLFTILEGLHCGLDAETIESVLLLG